MKTQNKPERRKVVARLVSGEEFWTPQRRADLRRRLNRMNLNLPEEIRREWVEFIHASR